MIAVLQRVSRASVTVDGETVGSCGAGLCILLGVADDDCERDAEALAEKIVNLRIFTDEQDKMNLSLLDVSGEMLVVSNFTLLAAYRKGKRPDYMRAAPPDKANALYEYFSSLCRSKGVKVGQGVFGAHMEVLIAGDGPVTITMDSKVLLASKKVGG
ncbi:MAG: D-tyrosyl-tRNA(Tyr) deacylase [Clostridia bacterium]|nr:D-tyrosyl-tRNA(Tyr) deacylase [Clostridia bacterium]